MKKLERKMIRISLDEVKKIALEILVDFDRVCVKNGLRYSLAYGTLLGAVRHRGFIPWDDDIDIIMPREDYNLFSQIADIELKDKYKLISINTDNRFGNPLPKIIDTGTVLHQEGHMTEQMDLGIYIDLFIVDKVPKNCFKRKVLYSMCKMYQKMWSFCGCYRERWWLVNIFRRAFNHTGLAYFFAEQLMNINRSILFDEESDQCSVLVYSGYGHEKDQMNLEEFDDLIYADFEGGHFKSIRKFDEYLVRHYGDYMVLPPLEKRVNHNLSCARKNG